MLKDDWRAATDLSAEEIEALEHLDFDPDSAAAASPPSGALRFFQAIAAIALVVGIIGMAALLAVSVLASLASTLVAAGAGVWLWWSSRRAHTAP